MVYRGVSEAAAADCCLDLPVADSVLLAGGAAFFPLATFFALVLAVGALVGGGGSVGWVGSVSLGYGCMCRLGGLVGFTVGHPLS